MVSGISRQNENAARKRYFSSIHGCFYGFLTSKSMIFRHLSPTFALHPSLVELLYKQKEKGYGPTFTRTPRNRSPGGHILFYLQFSTNKEKSNFFHKLFNHIVIMEFIILRFVPSYHAADIIRKLQSVLLLRIFGIDTFNIWNSIGQRHDFFQNQASQTDQIRLLSHFPSE